MLENAGAPWAMAPHKAGASPGVKASSHIAQLRPLIQHSLLLGPEDAAIED